MDKDKYGRTLAYVYLLDDRLLNAELIRRGYAHAYTTFPVSKMEEFRGLERAARSGSGAVGGRRGGAGDTCALGQCLPDRRGARRATGERDRLRHEDRHEVPPRRLPPSRAQPDPHGARDAAKRYGPCSVCSPPVPSATAAAPTAAPATTPPATRAAPAAPRTAPAAGRCQATTKRGRSAPGSRSQGARTAGSTKPVNVLQCPDWHGSPVDLGELFIVRKNGREAVAKLRTHQLEWEVILFVGQQLEIVQTQVCRTEEDLLATGECWKAAMIEKGWR